MKSGRSTRGAAAARLPDDPVPSSHKGRRHVRTQRVDYVIAALLTLVGAWVLWTGSQFVRAELHSMQARYRIDTWLSGQARWRLPEWLEAREGLRAAVAITPDNATLHDYLAALHMLRGRQAWADETLRHAFYGEAREHQRRALALRPSHGNGWAALAQAEYALEHCSSPQWEAWRKALHFGPYEPPVQVTLADLALACQGRAPGEVQAWLLAHHAQAKGKVRKQLEDMAQRHRVDLFKPAEAASVPK